MLLHQLHGVFNHLEGSRLGLFLASGHLWILIEHHLVGPLEKILAIFRWNTTEFKNSQQRQLCGHFLHKLTLTTTGNCIDYVARMLAKTRLIRLNSTRGKGSSHNLARLHLSRWVLIDGHIALDEIHVIF